MHKIKLHFTLVGKPDEWRRNLPDGINFGWTNKDTVEFVKETVCNYFGNRSIIMMHENIMTNSTNYPKFYAAGWFINVDYKSELVVISHGETMKSAINSVIESVKLLDWEEISVTINK